MKLFHAGVLVWLYIGAISLTHAIESDDSRSSVSILSWNVRNYNLCDRYVHGQYYREYPKPESEKEALRDVIAKCSPDILILQEIGGEDYLQELSLDLKVLEGVAYPYFYAVDADDQVRRLGVLSKNPVRFVESTLSRDEQFTYFEESLPVKRGLLEVEVDLGGQTLVLMGVHLKSRFTSDVRDEESAIRREKEARLIRNSIRKRLDENVDELILLVGDLNDHAGSSTYRRFTELSGNPMLIEVPVEDSHSEKWTYYYQAERRYEQIDFAFGSPSLMSCEEWTVLGKIVDDDEVQRASDHRPLFLELFLSR